MLKFLGQGSNPCHSRDPSHCSDNTRSLTPFATGNSMFIHIFIFCSQVNLFFFFFFCLFRPAPVTYGSSQARGWIRAAAADVHHSHSNARSELHLWATLQLAAIGILNPLSKAGVEPASSWILVRFLTRWATVGIPMSYFFYDLWTLNHTYKGLPHVKITCYLFSSIILHSNFDPLGVYLDVCCEVYIQPFFFSSFFSWLSFLCWIEKLLLS